MSSLFVSLSDHDKTKAENFFQIFETVVRGVYFDAYYRTGRSMPQKFQSIEDGRIKTAAGIVLLLSTSWLKSLACRREYVSAIVQERTNVIIPVQIDDVDTDALNEDQRETWRHIRAMHGQCYDVRALWKGSPFHPSPDFALNAGDHGHDATELAGRLTPFSIDNSATSDFEQRRERYRIEKLRRPDLRPYKGLQPYTEDDESFFFGRDKETTSAVRELDYAVRSRGVNFFFISGPSGAGKSSFMRAGVLPRLQQRRRDYVVLPTIEASKPSVWQDLIEKMTSSKAAALGLRELRPEPGEKGDIAVSEVQSAIEELAKRSGEGVWSRNAHTNDLYGPTVVLPIDQAEDLLLLSENPDAAGRAFSERGKNKLVALINDLCRSGPFVVIATTREAARSQLVHELCGSYQHVPFDLLEVSDEDAFRTILEAPPRLFTPEKRISDPLWIRLRNDFLGNRAQARSTRDTSLPLVAFTIQRLFDYVKLRQPDVITEDDYKAAGTLDTTISQALQTCRKNARDQRPHLFETDGDLRQLRLVSKPDQELDYVTEVILYGLVSVDPVNRSFVDKRLFLRDAETKPELLTVLKCLNHADCRLVTEKGDGPNKYYTLSHLSIIENVRDWYGRSRLIIELHSAVADVKYLAQAWDEGGKRAALLGALPHQLDQIAQVEKNDWLKPELLNDTVLTAFVTDVRKKLDAEANSTADLHRQLAAAVKEQKASNRRLVLERVFLGGACLLIGITAIAGGYWFSVKANAEAILDEAEAHLERNEVLDAARLHQSEDLDLFRSTMPWPLNELNDRMAKLADATDWSERSLKPSSDLNMSGSAKIVMRDGAVFVADRPGALVEWRYDVDGKDSMAEFALPGAATTGLHPNDDGSYVAFADIYDGMILSLNAEQQESSVVALRGLTLRPSMFAFSSDNNIVAAAAPDRRVGVWRVGAGPEAEQVLMIDRPSPQTMATEIALSPDGQMLAVGREQGRNLSTPTVSLFTVAEKGGAPRALVGLSGTISALTFDRSGQIAIAFDDSGRGCAWSVSEPRCEALRGHERPVTHVLVDGSKSLVYSVDDAGEVYEHDFERKVQGRHWTTKAAGVVQAVMSNDGYRLFLLDRNGCLSVVDLALDKPKVNCVGGEAIASWHASGVAVLTRQEAQPQVLVLPFDSGAKEASGP